MTDCWEEKNPIYCLSRRERRSPAPQGRRGEWILVYHRSEERAGERGEDL
jgi:hypothetical protein